jgi:superfamily II DNA/RNA helicase
VLPPCRSQLRFRVLDECDEMLNMGFVDDVEKILKADGVDGERVQTLLFSATLPHWVKDITKRFLKPGFSTVDLVGSDKMKVGRWCRCRRSRGRAGHAERSPASSPCRRLAS